MTIKNSILSSLIYYRQRCGGSNDVQEVRTRQIGFIYMVYVECDKSSSNLRSFFAGTGFVLSSIVGILFSIASSLKCHNFSPFSNDSVTTIGSSSSD